MLQALDVWSTRAKPQVTFFSSTGRFNLGASLKHWFVLHKQVLNLKKRIAGAQIEDDPNFQTSFPRPAPRAARGWSLGNHCWDENESDHVVPPKRTKLLIS